MLPRAQLGGEHAKSAVAPGTLSHLLKKVFVSVWACQQEKMAPSLCMGSLLAVVLVHSMPRIDS